MKMYFAIGCGGSIGALLRYLIGASVPQAGNFPSGTLCINIIGCFAMGYLTNFVKRRYFADKPALAKALTTGMIGAFTTFSTVSLETALLVQDGMAHIGLIYLASSTAGGLGALLLGLRLSPDPVQKEQSI
ncbi:CrcB protein [Terribacillus saccharophilus]|uniref:Fluoride-specific ion channel FluC n=1 Tax=Terribacillus saccharophilus TaxID=361277 RepID=A0AAX2EHJ5_9BACI|nr:CrcB protein [Terribacillus saccharophilus]